MMLRTNIVFLTLVLSSCYTQLPRHIEEKPRPSGPLPDVAIIGVSISYDERHWADSPEVDPITHYAVRVKNVGSVNFQGSLMINLSENWREFREKKFPIPGGIGKFKIASGDTVTITFERGLPPYPHGMPLRFLLRTDANDPHSFHPIDYFGREPIAEESYENNELEFVTK